MEEHKKQRRLKIDWDDVGGFLGSGSYAATFASESDDTIIYRFERFDESRRNEVMREVAIQQFLYKKKVGPCIAQIYEHEIIEDEDQVPKNIRDLLPHTTQDMVSMIKMDNGDAGDLRHAKIEQLEIPKIMGLLLWTFLSANTQYGFRHRDIKVQNIVLKSMPANMSFTFEFENEVISNIRVPYIPLLVDFGFASLLTTRAGRRHLQGTVVTMPPEALCNSLVHEYQTLNSCTNANGEATYDLWSLGVVFAELLLEGKEKYFFYPTKSEWARKLVNKFIVRIVKPIFPNNAANVEVIHHKIYMLLCIHIFKSIFTPDEDKPPQHLFNDTYTGCVMGPSFYSLLSLFRNHESGKLVQTYYEEAVEKLQPYAHIFENLFDWDPSERLGPDESLYDETFMLLGGPKTKTRTFRGFKLERLPLFELSKDYEFRDARYAQLANVKFIASEVCEVCQQAKANFVCSGCSRVVCGKKCHKVK